MALATNTRFQLAERLQADLQLTNGYAVVSSLTAGTGSGGAPQANDPFLMVSLGGTNKAAICISQRHYNSFNVVAELSSSAAEGLPEHVAYVLISTAASQTDTALIAAIVKRLGTSSVKFGFVAVGNLDEAHMTDAAVAYELPNDARLGASGQ
jgi:hypothetical protein